MKTTPNPGAMRSDPNFSEPRPRGSGIHRTWKILAAGLLGSALALYPAGPRQSVKPVIDPNGDTHFPAVVIPYSDLASKEAKDKFNDLVRIHASRDKAIELALKAPGAEPAIARTRRLVAEIQTIPWVNQLRSRFDVDIKPEVIAGVQTDIVTPRAGVPAANKDRVLLDFHGGGFTVSARSGGQVESIPIAGTGQFKVITVDYRMAPEYKFPAATEDVAKVYAEILKTYRPENIGLYGCSAGATLAAQSLAWFQKHGLPRPGAVSLAGGGAVIDHWGDSNYVSAGLGTYSVPNEIEGSSATGYFAGMNLRDPMISPGYDDAILRSFPASLIINGTRDLTLSQALYTHERMVDLGVDADLHVWEGAPHCFVYWETPESRQAWRVISRFFDKHLGSKAK